MEQYRATGSEAKGFAASRHYLGKALPYGKSTLNFAMSGRLWAAWSNTAQREARPKASRQAVTIWAKPYRMVNRPLILRCRVKFCPARDPARLGPGDQN